MNSKARTVKQIEGTEKDDRQKDEIRCSTDRPIDKVINRVDRHFK